MFLPGLLDTCKHPLSCLHWARSPCEFQFACIALQQILTQNPVAEDEILCAIAADDLAEVRKVEVLHAKPVTRSNNALALNFPIAVTKGML